MNHYAYYALKNESGYAFSSAIENCSFAGGTKFSFGMDFYYNGAEGVLFSQKESVTCRIVNKQLEWKTADWCLMSSSFTTPLIENGWNHIDVVYEEKQAILYLNAVEVQRVDINADPVYSLEDYHYLEQDIGYVRNVRIVGRAMTQEEIITNLMRTVVPKEHLWLYIPFDVPFCQDQGVFQKVVRYGGLSRCENMIKVLRFDGGGYVLLDGVKTNPGNAKMADFSIAVRVFPLPCSTEEAVLFENTGEEDLFQIRLLAGQKQVGLVFGTEKITLENSQLAPYEWTDLILVKKGMEVQCFINGQMSGNVRLTNNYQRKNAPRMVLGNKFKGYMDYIGIYGKSLGAEECLEVHQVEPYIFDEGLTLLFLFHGEKEENFLGEGTLLLHKNAEIALAEGTIYEEIIEPYNFRTKSEFAGNEFEKWQADFLADIVKQFSSQATGLDLSDLDGGAKEYLWNRMGMYSEAQELFLDFAAFTTAEIINLMSMAVLQELAFQAALSSMIKGTFSAFMMLNMDKIMAFQIGLGIAVGAAFIVDVAVKTKEKTKEPGEPPIPPIPPEPERGYAIELLSMQFCNGDTGSIPLRKDWQTEQSLPEWSSGSTESGICAYVRGSQTPKIKIRFRYLPAKNQPPVSIK